MAGSWYPATPRALAAEVDRYLGAVSVVRADDLVGVVAPHAGIMFSGPVAAHAYRLLVGRTFDVIVLVGPSHHVGFEGIAVDVRDGWETPFGVATIDRPTCDALLAVCSGAHALAAPHEHEHSLEMQMPFLKRVQPDAPIVPLLMGYQDRDTITALGDALGMVLAGRRALLVASSDLSHYQPAEKAAALDRRVIDLVERFDADGLMALVETRHEHACGGGPIVAVMRASRALGAREGRVLCYADSGDVSGDKTGVVGYMAAAFGSFGGAAPD